MRISIWLISAQVVVTSSSAWLDTCCSTNTQTHFYDFNYQHASIYPKCGNVATPDRIPLNSNFPVLLKLRRPVQIRVVDVGFSTRTRRPASSTSPLIPWRRTRLLICRTIQKFILETIRRVLLLFLCRICLM